MSRKTPKRSMFGRHCDITDCSEQTVRCTSILDDGKICGQQGHPDFYKSDEDHLAIVIEHAHFLENKDMGRNVFHKIGIIEAPEEIKVKTWRTYRGAERWKKIPYEVRKNLGW